MLASASMTFAQFAIVENACDDPVYLWSVSDHQSEMHTLLGHGGIYTEAYQIPAYGGVSIKISRTQSLADPIEQFEYTLKDTLWYDLSNVNGDPFLKANLQLSSSHPACKTVTCPANIPTCHAAYSTPHDDWATHMCDATSNTTLTLCTKKAAKLHRHGRRHAHGGSARIPM